MKFLYYSDYYTWNNFGTKRSLFLELATRFEKIVWKDMNYIKNVVIDFESFKPDIVMLASSGLTITKEEKQYINKNGGKIVGIGMSDPNYFQESRLLSYDAYITNYYETFEKFNSRIPCFYNKTACDFRFHKLPLISSKEYFASFIGIATHPYLKDVDERKKIVEKIRTSDVEVYTFGQGWGKSKYDHLHVEGEKFREIIQQSEVGIDIQDEKSPLAHRIFEYSACGTPMITRKRPEVENCFLEDEEILFYSSVDELLAKLKFYKKNPNILKKIGLRAHERCAKDHDIQTRVDDLIPFLERIFNER